jgi:fluoride ion exporter CrcB/FEX
MDTALTVQMLLTVSGIAVLCSLVTRWVKSALPDWRWTNVLVLGIGLSAASMACLVLTDFHPSAEAVYNALLVGFLGATVATFGYEAVSNLRGLAGGGTRSDRALLKEARATVRAAIT